MSAFTGVGIEELKALVGSFKAMGWYADDKIVLISDFGHHTIANLSEVVDWIHGKNMPRMRQFSRWWLAISCKYRLSTLKVYRVNVRALNYERFYPSIKEMPVLYQRSF